MPSNLPFSKYSKQMYFIVLLLIGGSQQHSLARWIVHPIVVAPEKIDSRGELFLFQFLEPPREKTALRFLPRQGERLLIRSTGLRNPP